MLKRRYPELSVAALVLGIGLILIAELGHVGWTKFFGAVLISLGGTGLGIRFGLAGPLGWPWLDALRQWRLPVAVAATIVLALPVVFALLAGLFGLGASFASTLGVLGALLTLVLAIVTVMGVWVAIRAIVRSVGSEPEGAAAEEAG